MPKRIEYDFFTWTSFPSSLVMEHPETGYFIRKRLPDIIKVTPRAKLEVRVNAKARNLEGGSHIWIFAWDGTKWVPLPELVHVPREDREIMTGTYNWTEYSLYHVAIPEGVTALLIELNAWKGITWWDDLRIFENDKLIYINRFSNWLPYQIAGAVALSIPTALYAIPRLKRR